MGRHKTPVSEKLTESLKLQSLLISLEQDELELLFDEGPELIEPLLAQIYQQDNPFLAKKAITILQNLRNPHTQEAACWQVFDTNEILTRQIVLEAGYLPKEPRKLALFYFLSEQWAKYETLDFDQSLLKTACDLGSDKVRQQVAQMIRASGKVGLLSVITKRSKKAQFASMTYLDWELAIDMLVEAKRWTDLWEWAQVAPPRYSIQIMRELALSNWQPANQIAFYKLGQLAQKCQTNLPPLGRLLRQQSNIELGYYILKTNTISQVNWDMISVEEQVPSKINTMAFSPIGNLLALSTYETQHLEFWDIKQQSLVNRLNLITHSYNTYLTFEILVFSPDGQILACWDRFYIQLIKVPSGEIIKILEADISNLKLAFSPNNTQLIGYNASKIRIWDLSKNSEISTIKSEVTIVRLEIEEDYPRFTTISPNTKYLAGRNNQKVWVWEVATGKLLHTLQIEGYPYNLYFSANSEILVIAIDSTPWMWNITDATIASSTQFAAYNTGQETSLFFSQTTHLKTIPNTNLRLWNINKTTYICSLVQTPAYVQTVVSPDGQYIISSDNNANLGIITSKLANLAYQTPEQSSLTDLAWIQEALVNTKLNPTELEKQWLRYIEALLSLRFEHEIELGEPMFKPTEFDIELESESNNGKI